jgi:hypothetical protein
MAYYNILKPNSLYSRTYKPPEVVKPSRDDSEHIAVNDIVIKECFDFYEQTTNDIPQEKLEKEITEFVDKSSVKPNAGDEKPNKLESAINTLITKRSVTGELP